MTYSQQLAVQHGFGTGDRIVVPKSGWNIVEHHAVLYGNLNGEVMVAENKEGRGVVLTRLDQFLSEARAIKRHIRYTGSYQDQLMVMDRVSKRLGRRYDLWKYNCEHFVNEVLHLRAMSPQVKAVGTVAAAAGGLYLLSRLLK
ncbi:MAG: lecithin retinol acyltransferase family protein [Bacteroidetes bacterium]|nr:lecithin retinol acyltransferase family protein [Bacteroidota bacterium]